MHDPRFKLRRRRRREMQNVGSGSCSVLCMVNGWLKNKEEFFSDGFARIKAKGPVVRYAFFVLRYFNTKNAKGEES